jgi:hypothetical protein
MSLSFLALMFAAAVLLTLAYRLRRSTAGYVAFLGLAAVGFGVVWSFIRGDEGGPILLAGGVGLVFLHRWAQRDRRRLAIARFARDHGLKFTAKDDQAAREDFRLFGRGDGGAVRNVMQGEWRGVPVKSLDYRCYLTRTVWAFYRVKRWQSFSVAILDLGASVPSVIAERNGDSGLAFEYMGFHDVQLQSDEFNGRYHVTCDDREFAYKFFDTRMLTWLLRQPDLLEAEVQGRKGLVALPLLEPGEMGRLLDAAVGFTTRIPGPIRRRYHMPESTVSSSPPSSPAREEAPPGPASSETAASPPA